jgi:hypothetical protein
MITVISKMNAFACMCSDFDVKKGFKEAEFVFIGTAIRNINRDTTLAKLLDLNEWGIRVSFKIEKVLKGNINSKVIAIIQNGSSCSMSFGLNKRYIVFGDQRTQIFNTPDYLLEPPSILNDSSSTYSREEMIKARKEENEELLAFESKIKNDYELMINTTMCRSFYEKAKVYKKIVRQATRLSRLSNGGG